MAIVKVRYGSGCGVPLRTECEKESMAIGIFSSMIRQPKSFAKNNCTLTPCCLVFPGNIR